MYVRNLTQPNGRSIWSAAACRRIPKRVLLPITQAGSSPSEKWRQVQTAVPALPTRAGMTLTELLVVVAVMVILIGTAVPMMRNGLEERKLREASRQLNTAFTLAKGIAAETGRPCGVYINTLQLPGPVSLAGEVFLAETPPPYAGDIVGATTVVSGTTATFDANSASLKSLVRKYDSVRFDYKGPRYLITTDITTGPPFVVNFQVDSGMPLPVAGTFAYQIFRQPVKSSSAPLELPAGAVIDLEKSGYGTSDTSFAGGISPIIVTFEPNGSVDRVWSGSGSLPPMETIHFLIGKVEQVGNDNLADNTCLWVSVNPQTGRVTTAENAYSGTLTSARQYAQSGQTMGGR